MYAIVGVLIIVLVPLKWKENLLIFLFYEYYLYDFWISNDFHKIIQ